MWWNISTIMICWVRESALWCGAGDSDIHILWSKHCVDHVTIMVIHASSLFLYKPIGCVQQNSQLHLLHLIHFNGSTCNLQVQKLPNSYCLSWWTSFQKLYGNIVHQTHFFIFYFFLHHFVSVFGSATWLFVDEKAPKLRFFLFLFFLSQNHRVVLFFFLIFSSFFLHTN